MAGKIGGPWQRGRPSRPSNDRISKMNLHTFEQFQSQRDCVCQRRVARNELPWVGPVRSINPEGVEALPLNHRHRSEQILAATPLGLIGAGSFPRVARSSQPWALGRNPVGIRARSAGLPGRGFAGRQTARRASGHYRVKPNSSRGRKIL